MASKETKKKLFGFILPKNIWILPLVLFFILLILTIDPLLGYPLSSGISGVERPVAVDYFLLLLLLGLTFYFWWFTKKYYKLYSK